jgi:hypothetical protein
MLTSQISVDRDCSSRREVKGALNWETEFTADKGLAVSSVRVKFSAARKNALRVTSATRAPVLPTDCPLSAVDRYHLPA